MLTVGLAADPTKTVTLDDTLESFTLGLSDDIHRITLLKEGHIHLVAQLKVLFETTEFGYLGLGACAGFLEVTKGKGFQGVVKRHGFGGVGGQTHGQHNRLRAPGSLGASSFPSRVFKGMRMAGQTGNVRRTAQNLQIVKVYPEQNLLVVKGSVPGANGSWVLVQK